MNNRIFIAVILLGVVVTGAGCLYNTGGSEEPTSTLQLDLDHGQSSTEYLITGEVRTRFLSTDQVFSGVMLCAYSENGEQLEAQSLGDMDPVDVAAVNMTMTERPAFVIVDHPDFREFDPGFSLIDWREGTFREVGGTPEEYIHSFQYIPPTDTGECGETRPLND